MFSSCARWMSLRLVCTIVVASCRVMRACNFADRVLVALWMWYSPTATNTTTSASTTNATRTAGHAAGVDTTVFGPLDVFGTLVP